MTSKIAGLQSSLETTREKSELAKRELVEKVIFILAVFHGFVAVAICCCCCCCCVVFVLVVAIVVLILLLLF